MTDAPVNQGGRPTLFSADMATTICDRMSHGRSLRSVCRDDDMPAAGTVLRWLTEPGPEKDRFRDQYARAREAMADAMSEEILEIADDGSNDWMEREGKNGTETVLDHEHVQRSRLRVDTRKWLLSKVAPRKYGERVTNEHTGAGGDGPVQIVVSTGIVRDE